MMRRLTVLVICLLASTEAQTAQISGAGVASSCPYGSALSDGCAGAQAHGISPYQHLADYKQVIMVNVVGGSGYTNGTGYSWTSSGGGCDTNATGTVDVVGGALTNGQVSNEGSECTSRPTIAIPTDAAGGSNGRIIPTVYQLTPHNAPTTYNLPGVDYPVGYDTTLSLKDPTSGGTLPACASYARNLVTINSSNCTLKGFDFTAHNTNLAVSGNLDGIVISNNNFVANGNSLYNVNIRSGSCGITIEYNQFNGSAVAGSGSGYELVANVHSSCYSGQITFEYNYCFAFDSKCINFGGANGNTPEMLRITEQYNMYSQVGLCAQRCSHGESEYSYSGYTSGTVYETISPWIMKFNVAFTFFYNGGGSATSQMAIEADAVNIVNADVEYNYVLTPGPWAATGSNNSAHSSITSSG